MSLKNSLLSSVALAAAFAAGLLVANVANRPSSLSAGAAPGAPIDQNRPGPTGASGPVPDLSAVAERAIPASVNISSTQMVRTDPMAQLFFGADPVQAQTSLGSGVIVSADGYVLTNSHVVGDRQANIKVTAADNRDMPAQIIGIDPYTDLAVLKVDANGITPLPWGDSGKLRVAEWVLAIGNPFEFNQTVTLGIISSPNRHDPQLAAYNDFIQTDAAINPGNSGGALINSRGELIGINTLVYGQSGGYQAQNLGFAIPSNLARRIMTELIKNGEVVRGTIGNLTLGTITADQARRNNLGTEAGVLVYNMTRQDPAFLNGKGILPHDVIVKFNQTTVTEQSQLQRLIAEAPIGSTATIDVIRAEVNASGRRGAPERLTFQVPIVRLSYATSRR